MVLLSKWDFSMVIQLFIIIWIHDLTLKMPSKMKLRKDVNKGLSHSPFFTWGTILFYCYEEETDCFY